MKRVLLVTLLAALSIAGLAQAKGGPITKQNGAKGGLDVFTSICSVSGYANYGYCGGDVTRFTDVTGRINAMQFDPGVYRLDFNFDKLTPGAEYRLWATRDGSSYLEVGRMVASDSGSVSYRLQTNDPAGLGFDLNTINGDATIVTSYWSGQTLVVNPDGTLDAAH
jgi:hypothetical protein